MFSILFLFLLFLFSSELQVFRLINLAHATLAKLAGDFVVFPRFADHEKPVLHVDSRCNALKRVSSDCPDYSKAGYC